LTEYDEGICKSCGFSFIEKWEYHYKRYLINQFVDDKSEKEEIKKPVPPSPPSTCEKCKKRVEKDTKMCAECSINLRSI
jgi:RNA polymerase subunit RPABC4/transcription elongation factor Spt4